MKSMLKIPKQLTAVFVAAITIVSTSSVVNAGSSKFPINVGERPESITKGFKGKFYVTVMNGKESGDGEVVVIDKKGNVSNFSKGFDEPKGIAYAGKNLYISDLTKVWKIDKKGKATVFADKKDFPHEVMYLNDVAATKDGIYVTDMGAVKFMRDEKRNLWPLNSPEAAKIPVKGRVYHISFKGKVTEVQSPNKNMLNPNGVGIDNKGNIMVGAFFQGNFLVTKNGSLTPLKGSFRGADAVEQDKKGNYYVSSWTQGKVWKIDGKTHQAEVIASGYKSAADFYLDEKKKRILLPDMLAGTVDEIPLK